MKCLKFKFYSLQAGEYFPPLSRLSITLNRQTKYQICDYDYCMIMIFKGDVYDHDYSTEQAHVRLFQPYPGYFCWKGLRGNAVLCMGTPIDVHSALEDFGSSICPRHPMG